MANPQVENGHCDIAHEIIEALARVQLPGNDWRVLMVLIRKTWGWKKKADRISFGQIADATGLLRRTVIRSLQNLELRRMVVVSKLTPFSPSTYSIQKDYDRWIVVSKLPLVSKLTKTSVNADTPPSVKIDTHKRKAFKENTKEMRMRCAEWFDALWKRYPRRLDRKRAETHFRATVKTEQDWEDIQLALANYQLHLDLEKTPRQYVKHGATWMNNWRDWLDYSPPPESESQKVETLDSLREKLSP